MNKLFIISLLLAVAFAAAAKKVKTNQDCEKASVPACGKCAFGKQTSKACIAAETTGKNALTCTIQVLCFADVKKAADKAAKKARKKLAALYSASCPTDKAQCRDTSQNCRTWASKKPSDCTANPDWMLPNCAMSCCPLCTGQNTLQFGSCPPKKRKDLCVRNMHKSCHVWATKKNECTKNTKWMKTNCMQSCCDTCKKDVNKCPTVKQKCMNKYASNPVDSKKAAQCTAWKKNGECRTNMKWMMSNCAKECCPICAPKAPAQAQVVQQAPRTVVSGVYSNFRPQGVQQVVQQGVYGGYSNGIPYVG